MAFPAPKPRNIEKDVKVFHWKDLSSALKKIIGKYSASPSSTLPPGPTLLTPVSSTGYAESSSAALGYPTDHHGPFSPRSVSASTTSTGYASSIPARVVSPLDQKPMGLGQAPQTTSTIRTTGPPQVPHLNPLAASPQWSTSSQHHLSSAQQSYQQLSDPNARTAWSMPYLENGLAGVAPAGTATSGPALSYPMPRSIGGATGPGDRK